MKKNKKTGTALIVGGGIAGMQAALDLADSGIKVYMVEEKPGIGGVMSQLDKTFPTNDCAMCTMAPRLVSVGRHKDIEVISYAEVEEVKRDNGNFKVTVRKKARYVKEDICTGCGACVNNCPTRRVIQIKEPEEIKLDGEYSQVKQIIEKYRRIKGPLMPILHEINRVYYYFPEEVLRYVAQELGYPLTDVLRIATFYNAFSIEPRGKYTISVCMGTACYVRKSEMILDKFSELLKIKPEETTEDRLFTLRSVRCLGCCGLAPAVMIGNEIYGKVKLSDIQTIINKYKVQK